jgi:hypothetical protein
MDATQGEDGRCSEGSLIIMELVKLALRELLRNSPGVTKKNH